MSLQTKLSAASKRANYAPAGGAMATLCLPLSGEVRVLPSKYFRFSNA
jgi:hypothetical protein